jgi:hypothetical protein
MSFQGNPYEAPKAELRAVGVRSGQREDVRKVAVAQKAILTCILIQIGSILIVIVGLASAGNGGEKSAVLPMLVRMAVLVALISGVISALFVFAMALRVYNTALGILFGIGALMPYVGLIVLLVVNGKATKILQANGYKVGLLGAKLSDVPER